MSGRIFLIVGVLLIAVGTYLLFLGYSSETVSQALVAWAAILAGALVILFGLGRFVSERRINPGATGNTLNSNETQLLIQAMGLIALADDKVREVELETIANIHNKIMGKPISPENVRKILSDFNNVYETRANFEEHAGALSETMKQTIIKCSHLIMVSDLEIEKVEEQRIYEIGKALGLNTEEVDDIISAASI